MCLQIVGVRRDCFGCGHTCISCKELFIRQCKRCGNEYCREDNDASSETMVCMSFRICGTNAYAIIVRLVQLYLSKNSRDVLIWLDQYEWLAT
jgi:hypothetical protein